MNNYLDLHSILEDNSKIYANNVAVQYEQDKINYQELCMKVKQLSSCLIKMNVEKGDIVAICMNNSIDMAIAIYSVLYVRAVVLPIDIDAPAERIKEIISDSKPKIALCDKVLQREINKLGIQNIAIENQLFTAADYDEVDTKNLNEEDNAFCIYTSGSTGKPKGIMLSYKGIVNHANAKISLLKLTNNSKICLSFNISFVASIWQIISPILLGAQLIIYDKKLIKKPYQFFKKLSDNTINFISITPHTLSGYLEYIHIGKPKFPLNEMQYIILTGDKVSGKLVSDFYNTYSHIVLINAYGQTECSDDTYHYIIPRLTHFEDVPIGKPIKNIFGFVLDENLNIVTAGHTGELYIGGVGVASKYLNNEELGRQKFLKLDLCKSILYKTGDLVKLDENSNVVYLGRIDHQIKIRGYRVELEEIETQINCYKGIIQSIVRIIDLNQTATGLEAIYTATQNIDKNALRDFIKTKLPDYMIPTKFIQVEDFSYTANGKLDRKNIPQPISDVDSENSNAQIELSVLQKKIYAQIKSNLEETVFPNVTIDTALSSVGIDSITFVKIVVSLEEAFDFEFDDEMLLFTAFPTLRSMINYVESKIL